MRKIAVKILTILLVVSAAILVLSGCASLDVQLDRDGSGTATLTLSKEEGVTKESIESELNEIFEGAAKLSQGRDETQIRQGKRGRIFRQDLFPQDSLHRGNRTVQFYVLFRFHQGNEQDVARFQLGKGKV